MYDLVIIGSGPAGLSAAVYAKRACLDVVVLEKEPMGGGQMIIRRKLIIIWDCRKPMGLIWHRNLSSMQKHWRFRSSAMKWIT